MEQIHTGHTPVMLGAVLSALELVPGMRVMDATLGGGGYTRALLDQVGPTGQVIALDWDRAAIDRFRDQAAQEPRLKAALETKRLILVRVSYDSILEVLQKYGWDGADALVADLGLSSDQLADPKRGISFQLDGPLDMRLNSDETVQAAHILNQWDEAALTDLFQTYGDEPEAQRLARAIISARQLAPLTTTIELRELIWGNVVSARRRAKIHPATKVFQALRIAVNSEHTHLERLLTALPLALRPGGRAAFVTFHSGEDAMVKHLSQKHIRSDHPTLCWVTKKPLVPDQTEIQSNPRARSAKVRIVERLKK